jgi:hypothetical protein
MMESIHLIFHAPWEIGTEREEKGVRPGRMLLSFFYKCQEQVAAEGQMKMKVF